MAVLLQIVGDLQRHYLLHDTTTIGRDPGCSVLLCDPLVALEHAVVEAAPNGRWSIRDAGSDCGIYIGGAPIQRHTLVDNDEIIIGTTRFLFRERFAPEAAVRWQERLPFTDQITLLGPDGVQVTARAHDISVGGMRAMTQQEVTMATGALVQVELPAGDNRSAATLSARVMHVTAAGGRVALGLLFLCPTADERMQVAEVVAALMRAGIRPLRPYPV